MTVARVGWFAAFWLVILASLAHAQTSEYAPDKIVVKLRPGYALPAAKGEDAPRPIFPHSPTKGTARGSQTQAGLERMYYVPVPSGSSVLATVAAWQGRDGIEYAEPYYLAFPMVVPNDPEAQITGGAQDYLEVIEVYDAWDVTTGDSTMVVAILDSGTELDHEDMEGQVWYNTADPVNGVDDDGNGFVDDYIGYDLADGDADVNADLDPHGLRVAGMSSAATNNGVGMAGVGYECKYVPVKVFRSADDRFEQGYEAIAYAADLGAQVINLSWGSTTPNSQFAIDLINYAVLERDAVVVAAAGNTAALLDFYPASLPNVLSVGASNVSDEKASFATWSPFIDMVAPGEGVYTVDTDNGYGDRFGSSFAAPLVAGAAALLRSYRPELTALQVKEQLRVTADDIYGVGSNATYAYGLGQGRLNVAKALVDSTRTAVRLREWAYQSPAGPYVSFGDTLYFTGELMSYLYPWTEGTATLSTESPYVTLLDSVYAVDSLGTLEGTGRDTLFTVYMKEDLPASTPILFRVDFEGEGGYEDYQHFRITSEPEFLSVDNGLLEITVGSQGNLGYNEDVRLNGTGWTWDVAQLMDHMGVVLALDSTRVSDNAISNLNTGEREQDWTAETLVKRYADGIAPVDIHNWLAEKDTLPSPTGLKMQQRWLADGSDSQSPWLIGEYRVANPTGATVNDVALGWLADWYVWDEHHNMAGYDSTGNLAYVADTAFFLGVGVAWLGTDSVLFRAIDFDTLQGHTSDVDTALSDAEKYALLTNEAAKYSAGALPGGNDVGLAAGYWIDSLVAGENRALPFALLVGSSLEELREAAEEARNFYDGYRATPPLWEVIEACNSGPTTLNPTRGEEFIFYADAAATQPLDTGQSLELESLQTDSVFYLVNTDSNYQGEPHRLEVRIREPLAAFTAPDTLVLNSNGIARARLTELSTDVVAWQWDFGQGIQSSLRQPSPSYFDPGTYTITLTVTNPISCVDSLQAQVRVFQRAAIPALSNLSICAGESVSLAPPNANLLGIYADEAGTTLLASGSAPLALGPIAQDSVLWVTNRDSVFESLPVRVRISTTEVMAAYSVQPDTAILANYGAILTDLSLHNDARAWYVDGNPLSENDTAYLALANTATQSMALAVWNSTLGCRDSVSFSITPTESPTVTSRTEHTCPHEEISWKPTEGTWFQFSADSAGQTILHKGTTYTAVFAQTDTVWVASLDGLLPGPAQPWIARILSADFTATPPADTFQVLDTVYFHAQNPLASSTLWQVNGGNFQTANPLRQVWLSTGTYTIRLLTLDTLGCRDTAEQSWVVIPRQNMPDTVTGWEENPSQVLDVYPNPAQRSVTVAWKGTGLQPRTVALYDITGRQHLLQAWQGTREQPQVISLSGFPAGLYVLRLEGAEGLHAVQSLRIIR